MPASAGVFMKRDVASPSMQGFAVTHSLAYASRWVFEPADVVQGRNKRFSGKYIQTCVQRTNDGCKLLSRIGTSADRWDCISLAGGTGTVEQTLPYGTSGG